MRQARVEQAGQQVGVQFHPGLQLAHRRAVLVDEAGSGHAHQHDAAAQRIGGQGAGQHVGRRDLQHAGALGRERQQHLPLGVGQAQRGQRGVAAQRVRQREREAAEVAAVVPGQQRRTARDAVGIDARIDEAGAGRRLLQQRQRRGVAVPGRQCRGRRGHGQARRQLTGARRALHRVQVQPQHHRVAGQRGGQLRVAGGGVGFGQDHVQPHQAHAFGREQSLDQQRQPLARPGPAALRGQGHVVDADDGDARVVRAAGQAAQALVVRRGVQRLHRAQRHVAERVREQQRQQRRAEPGPNGA